MRPKLSEEELRQVLKNKDPKGFGILYEMYSANLLGHIMLFIEDKVIAEDLLQKIWLKVWTQSEQYDVQKGRIFTWLFNITRNSTIDTFRSKAYKNYMKNNSIKDHIEAVEQKRAIHYNSDAIGIKQLVDTLEPKYAEVIRLVYLEGFTHLEAAVELNMPVGTVKTRVRCALRELRCKFD